MRYLLAVLMLPFLCLTAQANAKHAPLPDAVLQAKTIYLVNHTGKQSVIDSAFNEFQKSGRFSITDNKESADLVAVFSHGLPDGDQGADQGATQMEIFVRGNDDAAYEVTKDVNSGEGLVWRHVIHDSSAKNCVDAFLERLRQ